MVDFGQLLDPAAMASAAQPNTDELRGRWDQYLNDPKTQGALLSFAGQAAQPRQWGQSNFGALMSSLGQGGASVRATEELDRKQMEAESKTDLRESQAYAAEARSGAAGTSARAAEDRLAFGREREQGLTERSRLGRQIQAHRLYNEYVKGTQKSNESAALFRRPTTPLLPFNDWIQQNPALLQNLGLTPDMLQPAAPQTPGGNPNEASVPVPPRPGATPQSFPTPTPAAISALRSQPNRRQEFEAKYGPGSAARALSGGQ